MERGFGIWEGNGEIEFVNAERLKCSSVGLVRSWPLVMGVYLRWGFAESGRCTDLGLGLMTWLYFGMILSFLLLTFSTKKSSCIREVLFYDKSCTYICIHQKNGLTFVVLSSYFV